MRTPSIMLIRVVVVGGAVLIIVEVTAGNVDTIVVADYKTHLAMFPTYLMVKGMDSPCVKVTVLGPQLLPSCGCIIFVC